MTGGLLSGLLTEPSGASDVFSFGLVVYSDLAKSELLGVPPALLSAKGAVSAEVASSMLSGLLSRASSPNLSQDGSRLLGLALTGYAGSYGDGFVSTSEPPPIIAPKAAPKAVAGASAKLARGEEEETGLLYLAAGFLGGSAQIEEHRLVEQQQEEPCPEQPFLEPCPEPFLRGRHALRRIAVKTSLQLLSRLLQSPRTSA